MVAGGHFDEDCFAPMVDWQICWSVANVLQFIRSIKRASCHRITLKIILPSHAERSLYGVRHRWTSVTESFIFSRTNLTDDERNHSIRLRTIRIDRSIQRSRRATMEQCTDLHSYLSIRTLAPKVSDDTALSNVSERSSRCTTARKVILFSD